MRVMRRVMRRVRSRLRVRGRGRVYLHGQGVQGSVRTAHHCHIAPIAPGVRVGLSSGIAGPQASHASDLSWGSGKG